MPNTTTAFFAQFVSVCEVIIVPSSLICQDLHFGQTSVFSPPSKTLLQASKLNRWKLSVVVVVGCCLSLQCPARLPALGCLLSGSQRCGSSCLAATRLTFQPGTEACVAIHLFHTLPFAFFFILFICTFALSLSIVIVTVTLPNITPPPQDLWAHLSGEAPTGATRCISCQCSPPTNYPFQSG